MNNAACTLVHTPLRGHVFSRFLGVDLGAELLVPVGTLRITVSGAPGLVSKADSCTVFAIPLAGMKPGVVLKRLT